MNSDPSYLPPVSEPMLEKNNDLDWENLPTSPSDLNFRPALPNTKTDGRQTLCLLLVMGLIAIPFSMLFRVFLGKLFMASTPFAIACLIACWFGFNQARKCLPEQKTDLRAIWLWFSLPFCVWAMIALSPYTHSIFMSMVYFGLLAAPPMFILADEFATHAVHWFSASPNVPLDELLRARRSWLHRFQLSVSGETTSSDSFTDHYTDGWKRLGLAILAGSIPAIIFAATGPANHQLGFLLFGSVFVSMALSAVVVCFRGKASLLHWWTVFFGWFTFGSDQFLPNWVFKTPTGAPLRRQMLLIQACWICALSWLYLTDHFSWLLTCDPAFAEAIAGFNSGPDQTAIGTDYFLRGGQLAIFYFVLTVVVCAVAPAAFMLLALFLATGPLVHGLVEKFEVQR